MKVSFVRAKKRKIPVTTELLGRVRAYNVAEIRPQVDGIVLERHFNEGSFVRKGQQLYQIDPARYRAAYNMARGRLQSARAHLHSVKTLEKRYRTLVKHNAVSRQEYDNTVAQLEEARANVTIAKAEVENADIDLQYTKVRSPISGFIGKSAVTRGALVTARQAQALATVRALHPVYVDLSQPSSQAVRGQNDLASLTRNRGFAIPVVIKPENSSVPYPYKGRLAVRELSVNEDSGSIDLRAVVPNPQTVLLPGMFVKAYVRQIGESEKVLVPQTALTRDASGDGHVWVINQNRKMERRRVETGAMYGRNWIVENGVRENELIAMDNFSRLQTGMTVQPVAQEEGEKEQPAAPVRTPASVPRENSR